MYCFYFFSILSQLIMGDNIHMNTVIIKNFLVEKGLLYLGIGLCVFSVSWWRQFMGFPLCISLSTCLLSPCSPFFCFVFEVECAQWLDLATSKQSTVPWVKEYVDWDQHVYLSTSDDHFPKQRCAIHASFTCMESHADISTHSHKDDLSWWKMWR